MQSSIEKINTQIFEDFLPHIRLIRTIGEGAFAQVYLIYDEKQQNYLAVKKIPLFGLCEYERKLVLNQAKILSSIQHPNIIRFHSCLYDNNEENVYIFMEFAKEGDLLNLIFRARLQRQQIKEKVIWKIISDIAQALNYLHSNNIIHRDIKPANILQQGNTFKLADMNVSKIKEEGKKTCTNVGTPLYTSPEVAKNEFYNEKCDIWSLGVVIYELCCFKNPFTKASLTNLVIDRTEQTKSAIDKIPLRYSRSLSDIIKRMLKKDPNQRISIKEILQICQNQGMTITFMSSNQKIGQFKTIVFPPSSQRWVNLVHDKEKKKREDLDLTIDQILKESQLRENSSFLHRDDHMKSSFLNQDQQKENINPRKQLRLGKLQQSQNELRSIQQRRKQAEDVFLQQDEYCLSNIKVKKNVLLKSTDKNVIKVNNFLKKEIENLTKPTHRVLNPRRFLEGQSREQSRGKITSTESRHRKFQRECSKTKGQTTHSTSRDKNQGEYGFKFIKLSKNLPHLQHS